MVQHIHYYMLLALFVNILSAEAISSLNVEKFKSDEVVPDVLDNVPAEIATVKYGSLEVNMGNVLTPSQVKNPPSISFSADPNKLYTLVMVDPDAPSRTNPVYREWLHWRVVNIPGNSVAEGETITAYRGAGPPKGTGLHRYVFAVFEQRAGKITFDEPKIRADQRSASDRGSFSLRKFASKYSLGNPFAGNFFQAEWEG